MSFIHFADPANAVSVSFPGLGLDFSLSREAIFIGPLTVYWYGIIVVTGIALGVAYAIWRAGQFGLNRDKYSDVLLYSIMFSLVGARAYYVAFSWDYYKDHLDEIVKIWNGGIAFYGGVLAALICAYLLCRLWKVSFIRGTDAALGGVLLGQSIGRWGNFMNVEAFGGYYEGVFRMISPAVDSYFYSHPDKLPGFTAEQVWAMSEIPVHPTFLYESVCTMLGFLFIVWYTKRRRFTGELTLLYFFINGFERMLIEGLRTDSLTAGSIRVSQMLAFAMVICSAAAWVYLTSKVKKGTAPAWCSLEPPVEQAAEQEISEEAAEIVEENTDSAEQNEGEAEEKIAEVDNNEN